MKVLIATAVIIGVVVFARRKPKTRKLRKLPSKFRFLSGIIQANNDYYNSLSQEEQAEFTRRVGEFIEYREWIPRSMKEITMEMKVIIASHAVQITFGYPALVLAHFKRIILYPIEYPSRVTGKKHKGEVNALGVIVLSWNHVMDGVRIPDDGINLVIHEIAHALEIENIVQNGEWAFIPEDEMKAFKKEARKVIPEIDAGTSLLRPYAATNQREFFAVVVENFFERPAQLREVHPTVYDLTAKILRQEEWAAKQEL
ncbi:MAG: zinc-dependent peptidase [Flavobacteriales bacterium]|nr:zinc-dependent peptidase [Flavobacteriales bacterium]